MCNEGRVHADYHAREDDGTRATFSLVDYSVATTSELIAGCPFESAPAIVTSNPPYIPLPHHPTAPARSRSTGDPTGCVSYATSSAMRPHWIPSWRSLSA